MVCCCWRCLSSGSIGSYTTVPSYHCIAIIPLYRQVPLVLAADLRTKPVLATPPCYVFDTVWSQLAATASRMEVDRDRLQWHLPQSHSELYTGAHTTGAHCRSSGLDVSLCITVSPALCLCLTLYHCTTITATRGIAVTVSQCVPVRCSSQQWTWQSQDSLCWCCRK